MFFNDDANEIIEDKMFFTGSANKTDQPIDLCIEKSFKKPEAQAKMFFKTPEAQANMFFNMPQLTEDEKLWLQEEKIKTNVTLVGLKTPIENEEIVTKAHLQQSIMYHKCFSSHLQKFTEQTEHYVVADCGAEKTLVGDRWLIGNPLVTTRKLSRSRYQFGSGDEPAIQTVNMPFNRDGEWTSIVTDVIKGPLPALLGRDAQKQLKLSIDPDYPELQWKNPEGYKEAPYRKMNGSELLLLDPLNEPQDKEKLKYTKRNSNEDFMQFPTIQARSVTKITKETMKKLHQTAHPTFERMFNFVKSTFKPEELSEEKTKEIKKIITEVIEQ